LREVLERELERDGLETLYNRLIKLDPDCASFIQTKNPRRVVRALEYVLATGGKFSAGRGRSERQFNVLKIGFDWPRQELYQRIDASVEARIKLGMIEEVEELLKMDGLSFERLQQFGLEYRVISNYLIGKSGSLAELIQRLKWDSHAYARRQLTWFRRDKEIQWVKNAAEAEKLVAEFIK